MSCDVPPRTLKVRTKHAARVSAPMAESVVPRRPEPRVGRHEDDERAVLRGEIVQFSQHGYWIVDVFKDIEHRDGIWLLW